jgi:hypothetical protein
VRLERIRSTEKSNDLIGNRTRDLPAYSIMPQSTLMDITEQNPSIVSDSSSGSFPFASYKSGKTHTKP